MSNDNIDNFLETANGHEASYNNEAATELRGAGTSYLVDGLKSFEKRASKHVSDGIYFEDVNGKKPAGLEVGNYLSISKDRKTVQIGSESEDIKGNSPGITFWEKSAEAYIHFHPNNNKSTTLYKKSLGTISSYGTAPGDLGPSGHDLDYHQASKGFYNIVIGDDKSGNPTIYFYQKGMEKDDVISVPLNIIEDY